MNYSENLRNHQSIFRENLPTKAARAIDLYPPRSEKQPVPNVSKHEATTLRGSIPTKSITSLGFKLKQVTQVDSSKLERQLTFAIASGQITGIQWPSPHRRSDQKARSIAPEAVLFRLSYSN